MSEGRVVRLECPEPGCGFMLARETTQPRRDGEPETILAAGVRHGWTMTAAGVRDALYCPRCKRWRDLTSCRRTAAC